jgi:hypothetical protein
VPGPLLVRVWQGCLIMGVWAGYQWGTTRTEGGHEGRTQTHMPLSTWVAD